MLTIPILMFLSGIDNQVKFKHQTLNDNSVLMAPTLLDGTQPNVRYVWTMQSVKEDKLLTSMKDIGEELLIHQHWLSAQGNNHDWAGTIQLVSIQYNEKKGIKAISEQLVIL